MTAEERGGMTDLIAVDAHGFCWRVLENGDWSMCPVNPDNSPIPTPVTFYVPIGAPAWARLCAAAANLGAALAEMDNAREACRREPPPPPVVVPPRMENRL